MLLPNTNDFLKSLYQKEDEDDAIDFIFDNINILLFNRKFEECDLILEKVDLTKIPIILMISFLTITGVGSKNLKNRSAFYLSVEEIVIKERGKKAAERLLKGLD